MAMKSDKEGFYLVNEVKDLLGCNDYILKNKLIATGALKFEQFETFGFRYFPKEHVLKIKKILDERRANLAVFAAEQQERRNRELEQERIELLQREQELLAQREQLAKINREHREKIWAKQERERAKQEYEREQRRIAEQAAENERRIAEAAELERISRKQREKKEQRDRESRLYYSLPIDMQMFLHEARKRACMWKGVNCTGYLSQCPSCGWRVVGGKSLFVSYDTYDGFMLSCGRNENSKRCTPEEIMNKLDLPMMKIFQ